MPKFNIGQVKPSEGAQNYRLEWVNISDIVSDPRNNIYSMGGIESLAESIEISGLLQPPLVRRTQAGGYQIISGHRRIEALKLLAKESPAYQRVQVQVDNDSDEISIGLKLIDANAETRILSNAELMAQAAELTRLLTERKKQEHLPGRVRDMVAKRLEMSAGAVGELLAINNNLPERLKQAFKEGKITKSIAVKLSKLEDQYKEEFEKMLTGGILEASQITSELIEDRIRKLNQKELRQKENVSESDTKQPAPAVTIEYHQPNEEEWQRRKEKIEKHRQQEKIAEAEKNVSESDTSDQAVNYRQEQQTADEEKELPPWGGENPTQKEKNRERDIAKLEVLLKVLNEMWRELADGTKSYAFPEQARYDAANYLGKIKAELQKEWIILKG